MKSALVPAVLLLLAWPVREEVELHFAPEEGTVLKRVFLAEAEYRLTDMSASIDGDALEAGEFPEYSTGFREHVAVTDTLESVADGRPTEFVRVFDELQQESTETLEGEESSGALSSPLQGRAVRYTYEAEEERYRVESADDDELDDSLAQSLAADMDLLLVLPEGEVEPGAEWDLDPRLYLAFMWPSGLLEFQAEGEEASEEERDASRQTIERLEGTGKARLEEVREEDGTLVAIVHVELEITTASTRVQAAVEEEDFEIPEVTIEAEIERTLEGTVVWDLTHGHALSAELECRASRLMTESWTGWVEQDGEEAEVEIERARLLEGTIRYTATIERQ